MLRAFSTAATGMTAQQTMVDVIANNLANVNTSGFKRSQINFQDLLYVTMEEPGAEVASGITSPSGVELSSWHRSLGRSFCGSSATAYLLRYQPRGVVHQVDCPIRIHRRSLFNVVAKHLHGHGTDARRGENAGQIL